MYQVTDNIVKYFNNRLKYLVEYPSTFKYIRDDPLEGEGTYTFESNDNMNVLIDKLRANPKLLAKVKDDLIKIRGSPVDSIEDVSLIFSRDRLKIKYITKITGKFGELNKELDDLLFSRAFDKAINFIGTLPSEFWTQRDPFEYIIGTSERVLKGDQKYVYYILNLDFMPNDDKVAFIVNLPSAEFTGRDKMEMITDHDLQLRSVDDLISITYSKEKGRRAGVFGVLLRRQSELFSLPENLKRLKANVIYEFGNPGTYNDPIKDNEDVSLMLDEIYSLYGCEIYLR